MRRPTLTSIGESRTFGRLSTYIFLVLASLCTGCWGCINTNLTECQLCSTRENVPCEVQRLGYLCIPPIPDTDEAWPGPPRSLEAHVRDIGGGIYRAEFTWQAPYDSSIDSLRGFLMMVHCEDRDSIGPARCFYANLTDGTWVDRRRAHDIKFKFTCVQSSKNVKVTLNLSSLPRPPNSIQSSVAKAITLPGSRPKWNPLIDTEVKLGPDSTSSLKVRFQPLYPGAAAHNVILTKNSKSINRTLIRAPQNKVTFTHVPSNDNYTIWLRPVNGREQYIGDHFLESKPFNIPVMPQKRFEATTDEPAGMDHLQVATVILVPILMLLTATGTVIFFCRKRGKFQIFRSVPNSQTNEQLASETLNNQLEIASQEESEQCTTIIAVLCSQRNIKVEKVSKLFIQFIKSKAEDLTLEDSSSGFNIESYVRKWRTGQRSCVLLVLLSEELLDGVDKVQRGLDISTTPGLKLDIHLLNLLLDIHQLSPARLPPVMLVCLYSDLCARFLELLPNLGQLYSIVDDIDRHKCQLRASDLEQLFVSMSGGQLSPPVTLSHNNLTGCVQTKLLLSAIQELLNARAHKSKTPYSMCKPNHLDVAMDPVNYQCAYRPPGVARHTFVYQDPVRHGSAYCDNGCVRQTTPTYWTGQTIDPRHSSQPCVRTGSFPDNPRHTHFESFSGQVDSGFDTMTSSVGNEEAENVPFVIRCQVAANSGACMKKHTHNGTRQEELAVFISPESDDEYDGVSLSQRIMELNQRHTTDWSKP